LGVAGLREVSAPLGHRDVPELAREAVERLSHLEAVHRQAVEVEGQSSGSSGASVLTESSAACQSIVKYMGGLCISGSCMATW
jgi:hypothetical protein